MFATGSGAVVTLPPLSARGHGSTDPFLVPSGSKTARGVVAPTRMAKPTVAPLNSFAVLVRWIPPVDAHYKHASTLSRKGSASQGMEIPVTGYRLRYRATSDEGDTGGAVQLPEVWEPDAKQATLKWLVGGTSYFFEVMAFNAVGEGPWSDPSDHFLMPQLEVPGPRALSSTARDLAIEPMGRPTAMSTKPDSIEIKLQTPCHRGSVILSYDVLCSKDPSFSGDVTRHLRIDGHSTKVLVESLHPNTVYYFKYRANNNLGSSPWSEQTSGVATAAQPPVRPSPPERCGDSSSWLPFEITIRWEPPESYNIPIQHYSVRRSTSATMEDATEVPVGVEDRKDEPASRRLGASGGLQSGPSSPTPRRPGFSKGSYALTQMRVKGLWPHTTYYFQVKATSQIGESAWSPVSLPMRTSLSPPARCRPPVFIAGTRLDGIRLSWDVPEDYDIPGGISSYDVRVSQYQMMKRAREIRGIPHELRKTVSSQISLKPSARSQMLTVEATADRCWEPGVNHFYQVRAVTAGGVGEWSESSLAMLVSPEVPLRPDAPEHFQILPRAIVVKWNAPDCRGSPIVRYRLRYDSLRDMVRPVEVSGLAGPVTEFPVAGLHPHKNYHFQVAAVNAVGSSDWSVPSRPVAVMQTAPAKLSSPRMIAHTPTSITVAVTVPADYGTRDGDLVQSYVVQYAQAPNPIDALAEAVSSGEAKYVRQVNPSAIEVKDLQPSVPVAMKAFAINEFGEGEPSEVVILNTSAAVPEPPAAPYTVEVTSSSIHLRIVPNGANGSAITHYNIEVQDKTYGKTWETGLWVPCYPEGNDELCYGISRLRPGTRYHFRVSAANKMGVSDWSESSGDCFTTPTPPEPVMDVTSEDIQATSFKVRWVPPHDNGAAVTEYCVQYCVDSSFGKGVQERKGTDTRAFLTDCTAGCTCYARVAAANSEGYGDFGAEIIVHMAPDVPYAPTHVRCLESGPTTAKVSWLVPYDCGTKITAYWVRYTETATDGRPLKDRDVGEVVGHSRKRWCLVEPLFSLREYVYEVAAENAMGVGPYSPPTLPMRTQRPEVPTAPKQPLFMSHTLTSLVLSWTGADYMGADILDQTFHISTDPTFPDDNCLEVILPSNSTFTDEGACAVFPKEKGVHDDASRPTTVGSRPTTGATGSRPTTTTSMRPTTADSQAVGVGSRPVTSGSRPMTGSSRPATGAQKRSTGIDLSMLPEEGSGNVTIDHTPWQSPSFGDMPWHHHDIVPVRDEALEERRRNTRKAVQVDGFASVVQRLQTRKWKPGTEIHTIQSLKPGTFYYARVAARNIRGLGPFSPVSERLPTDIGVPDPIPQDPGIVLLKTGCTTLTFGWKRPFCQGAPIQYYSVRCAETDEGLWSDDCFEFVQEEMAPERWDGMIEPLPTPPPLQRLSLQDQESISMFVEYVLLRFGTLEESWEWLDVNGNGDVSEEEFLEGDVDSGPPFIDFQKPEVLPKVWGLLDNDGGGSISMGEYNKLRPYMEAISAGSAGANYDGIYCLVPNLTPGKAYHVMARAVNKVGVSEWTQCITDPHRTEPLTPPKMLPLEGVAERRTTSSVTYRWVLPYDNGAPITSLEIRWVAQDIDDGLIDKREVARGTLVEIHVDPDTGELPLEHTISGVEPGQLVFAVVRSVNRKGGGREWSDLPGPGPGSYDDIGSWACSTLPDSPYEPVAPEFRSLVSEKSETTGLVEFKIGRNNGLPFASFTFQLMDESGSLVREWESASDAAETAAIRHNGSMATRPIDQLAPGEKYSFRVKSTNACGTSAWSEASKLTRMPSDVPQTPRALLSEFQGLSWIELKWFVPHHNGEPISKYDIKVALDEYADEEDWRRLDEDEVARNTRAHGDDGRSTIKRDTGALIFQVDRLDEVTPYFFSIRAYNAIGWGEWSEVSRFMTRPSKPGKVGGLVCDHIDEVDLYFSWKTPKANGASVERYDLVGGPSLRCIRWAKLSMLLLGTTVDADMVFGSDRIGAVEIRDTAGNDEMRDLSCIDLIVAQLPATKGCFCKLSGFLPGQTYYFIIRGVSHAGKGAFSEIAGPFTLKVQHPQRVDPLRMWSADDTECKLLMNLPYNMGMPIEEVVVQLSRIDGPLAAHEVHPETGECHDHIAKRELVMDPLKLPFFSALGAGPCDGRWVSGTTGALLRAHRDEKAAEDTIAWSGHLPTLSNATGRGYIVTLDGLRPGTRYTVSWYCLSTVGTSCLSEPTEFKMGSAVPDRPGPLLPCGL